jgi:hypothetical protein
MENLEFGNASNVMLLQNKTFKLPQISQITADIFTKTSAVICEICGRNFVIFSH